MHKLLTTQIFLLLMGLIFLGPFTFAQEPAETTAGEARPIEEVHDTQKLDNVLREYNKDAEQVLKDAEQIQQMQATGELSEKELGTGQVLDPDEDLDKQQRAILFLTNKKKMDPKELKSMKYEQAITVAVSPLQKMSEEDLHKLLLENTKRTANEVYIKRFPRLALYAVRLIKDKEALPMMGRIVDQEEKLIRFSGLMISTMIVAFILKRFFKKEGRSVREALTFWFIRFLIITALRAALIMYFYSVELTPAFNIAKKTFF